MADLIAIGEALVELNQPRNGAPFVQGFGGDTSNAMIAAARMGADAAYFTAVGADRFGQALTELWMREGVDASRIVINGGAHTGFISSPRARRAMSSPICALDRRRAASARAPPVDRIRETKILHVSGISQAISSSSADAAFAAIDIAHDARRLVSYDPNLRLKLWPLRRASAIIHEAMRHCDIALPGLDDALALTSVSDPTPSSITISVSARASSSSSSARRRAAATQSPRTHRGARGRGRRRHRGGRCSTARSWPNSCGRAIRSPPRASPTSRRCRHWATARWLRCCAAPTSRR